MPSGIKRAIAIEQANINATRRGLARIRTGGYNYTQSVLDTIFGNLSTTQRGIGRQLTRQNARTYEALQRIAAATARQGRNVPAFEAAATAEYGGAFQGTAAQAGAPAAAVARGAARVTQAQLGQGKAGVQAGAGAIKIEQAAAKEAGAGAAYQESLAMQQRQAADFATVAEMQNRLDLQRLSFQQDKAMARFQQRLQDQGQGSPGVSATEDALAQSTSYTQARAILGSAVTRYHLGPAQKAQLEQYLRSLYPNGEQSSNQLLGLPTKLDDADKQFLRDQVAKWFAANPDVFKRVSERGPDAPALFKDVPSGIWAPIVQKLKDQKAGPELIAAAHLEIQDIFANYFYQRAVGG